MCFIAEDSPEFSRHGIRTARAEHRCTDCGRGIAVGERYRWSTGKQAGEFWYSKRCGRCQILAECIHALEMRRGCRESESWPMWDGVSDAAADYMLLPVLA